MRCPAGSKLLTDCRRVSLATCPAAIQEAFPEFLGRILDGSDYIVKQSDDGIDIKVLGVSGKSTVVPVMPGGPVATPTGPVVPATSPPVNTSNLPATPQVHAPIRPLSSFR